MNITIKDLLDAGVHFGHQLRRYNPRSKKFVFDNRHGISIIDLEKTYAQLEKAAAFVEETVASGKKILFIGTKRQAQEVLREAATECNMPFSVSRWLGGTLTNFATVKGSIEKYKKFLAMEADGSMDKLPNKEAAANRRDMQRMHRNFEGLLEMNERPAALFVVDTRNEEIAVAEAIRLGIPVIGLVDTNSDPTILSYPIPGNDDSIKSIRIIVETLMDAIQNGIARREASAPSQGGRNIVVNRYDSVKEEQLPVTGRGIEVPGSGDVPESYSTDA
ncbi:MAG: 30S ribosomal protein S2 [Opitutales bacterium]|nr:30S ribosomal protein S2 [Opitutales bacterium]